MTIGVNPSLVYIEKSGEDGILCRVSDLVSFTS